MTDTSQPAETPATETPVAEPEAIAEAEAVGPSVAEPSVAAPSVAAPESAEAPNIEDVKRHFREALDRKRQANAPDSAGTGARGKGKAQVAHGPASSRRSFRRKSG